MRVTSELTAPEVGGVTRRLCRWCRRGAAAASEYVEIESILRFRGIDEPSRDLDTLKQILEALQLKGLLHSGKPPEHIQVRHRNFIYDESPVVIVGTPRSSGSSPINWRRGINCSPSGGRNQIGYNSHSPEPEPEPNHHS
ncbi:SNF2 domain-containing protein [Striga asiatica]|uniref:SNF2 domain-containing protein n=1 Tax=Striga asiatica TaxID=4170 RepID=A0A5A7PUA9_STRAF|nr:SNF2 domain-containing protein [Striga asiatica]